MPFFELRPTSIKTLFTMASKSAPRSGLKSKAPRFSKKSLQFLLKAPRQKRPDWLERNQAEFVETIQAPLQHLARFLKTELASVASDYHFPLKGIPRLKRSANRAKEYGSLFRDYVSYSASRPSASRFDKNPNLFFMIYPEDKDDSVLIAGGLYMASSRQVKAIREAIANDASAFDRLFASKEFKKRFPDGFSDERKSSRVPRGFDASHPRIEWLKLQAFFVWKSYTLKEFSSEGFPRIVADDFRQVLRLNELLELAIQGRLPAAAPKSLTRASGRSHLEDQLEAIEPVRRKMDF